MHSCSMKPALVEAPDGFILRCSRGGERGLAKTKRKFAIAFKFITEKVQQWRRYRAAVRELSQLSDRDLADLGLCRAEIETVARKGARH